MLHFGSRVSLFVKHAASVKLLVVLAGVAASLYRVWRDDEMVDGAFSAFSARAPQPHSRFERPLVARSPYPAFVPWRLLAATL
jgi:surfactin synthase thioesterase subunit